MPENNVIELRQYTLRGGKRDILIELFEREFIEPQNAAGARVLGIFRDLDDPDRFVWMRGFDSMAARAEALTSFYTGPIWKAHRDAANATMLDSDNVLLLQPVDGNGSVHELEAESGVLTATIHYLVRTPSDSFLAFFNGQLRPHLVELGAAMCLTLVTHDAPNSFPHLPVRQEEPVLVWFARWPDEHAAVQFEARVAALSGWRDQAPELVFSALMRKPERLRLKATTKRWITKSIEE